MVKKINDLIWKDLRKQIERLIIELPHPRKPGQERFINKISGPMGSLKLASKTEKELEKILEKLKKMKNK